MSNLVGHLVALLLLVVVTGLFAVPLTPEDLENSHTTVIDPTNAEGVKILKEHNVNLTELQYQRELRVNRSKNSNNTGGSTFFYPTVVLDSNSSSSPAGAAAAAAAAMGPGSDRNLTSAFETRRQMELEFIRNKVGKVIQFNSTDISAHLATQPIHDIAVYSACTYQAPVLDIFRVNNNSFNLFFDPPTPDVNDKRMYLSSATFRLFKMDRSHSGINDELLANGSSGECRWNYSAHPEELIRVTVSAYIKRYKKYRKRTFNSIMIQKAYSGWVELNVRLMIGQLQRRNLGVSVDVHDQDENQLSASQFFHPSNCVEASDKPFPFTQFQNTYDNSCHKAVPRFPRIDYQYKFCDKTRMKDSIFNKRCPHFGEKKSHHRHQHHINNNHHHNHHPHRSNSLDRQRTLFQPFASFEQMRTDEDLARRKTIVYSTTTREEDVRATTV